MLELIYTSARSGLRSGSSGFTFVAWTRGTPPLYVNPLEDLSGYKPVWLPGDPHSSSNPVSFSYQKVKYGNLAFSVISRIGYAGLDYSGRSNKTAHHIIASDSELLTSSYGPVGYCLQKDNFISVWNTEPQLLNERRLKVPKEPADCQARTWQKWKGDAGWAGVVAAKIEELLCSAAVIDDAVYLEYTPDLPPGEVLHMVSEVLLLLPEEMQMRCTFNTYFIQPRIGVDVLLRCALTNNPAVQTMRKLSPQKVISLTNPEAVPEKYANNPYVQTARTGQFIQAERTEILPVIEQPPAVNKTIFLNTLSPAKQTVIKLPALEKNSFTEINDIPAEPEMPQKSSMRKFPWMAGIIVLVFSVIVSAIVFLKHDELSDKKIETKTDIQNEEPNGIEDDTKSEPESKTKFLPPPKKEMVTKKSPAVPRKKTAGKKTVVPEKEKKKIQKPVPPQEKYFSEQDANDFFVNFNMVLCKNIDVEVPLCNFDESIEKIEIVTEGKRISATKILYYPDKNTPFFQLSGKDKSLCIISKKSSFNEQEQKALRNINEIIVTLKTQRHTIPFEFSESLLRKAQPTTIKIKEGNYKIEVEDSPFYSKNSRWIDIYLKRPSPKEFTSNIYQELYEKIKKYNNAIREHGRMQSKLNEKKAGAKQLGKEQIRVTKNDDGKKITKIMDWENLKKKEKWNEELEKTYKDSLTNIALIMAFCGYNEQKTKRIKEAQEVLHVEHFGSKPKKKKQNQKDYFEKYLEDQITEQKREKSKLEKKLKNANAAVDETMKRLQKEADDRGVKIDIQKGKQISPKSPEIMKQLKNIAKEKVQYRLKQ